MNERRFVERMRDEERLCAREVECRGEGECMEGLERGVLKGESPEGGRSWWERHGCLSVEAARD